MDSETEAENVLGIHILMDSFDRARSFPANEEAGHKGCKPCQQQPGALLLGTKNGSDPSAVP